MPTFSISPSIDTYPLGASVTVNGEFDQPGVTAPWDRYLPAEGALSWVKYRAPLQKTKGSLRLVTSQPSGNNNVSVYANGVYATFASGQVFGETWVRNVSQNSGTGVKFDLQLRCTDTSDAYVVSRNLATVTVAPGSGWTRLVGTVSRAALTASNPTAARVNVELYTTPVGGSAAYTGTYDIGRLSCYVAAAPAVQSIQITGPGGVPQTLNFPITVAEPTASIVRDAVRGLPYITETP